MSGLRLSLSCYVWSAAASISLQVTHKSRSSNSVIAGVDDPVFRHIKGDWVSSRALFDSLALSSDLSPLRSAASTAADNVLLCSSGGKCSTIFIPTAPSAVGNASQDFMQSMLNANMQANAALGNE